jgi:hypoxanthine phosphoribosyltransferase
MSTITVHNRKFEPFIQSDIIAKRISDIATQMNLRFEGKNPLFLAVLNGAFIFAADLLRHIDVQSEISFVKIASYEGMQTTGDIKELIGFTEKLANRHVVILEDIIDTGMSMQHILKQVEAQKPASVSVTTLLLKPSSLQLPVKIDYIGFEIESRFVLGYGMDYDGIGRNLPEIYAERID